MTNVNNFRVIDSYPLFLLFLLRCFRHPKRMCIGAQKYTICQKRKTFCQFYHSAYIISYISLYRSSKDCGLFIHLTFVIMKYLIQRSEFSARLSDLYNDVEHLRDDILSYPFDVSQEVIDERTIIAQQLYHALCELSDAYQAFSDLRNHFYRLHELEHNVEIKHI